MRRAYLNVALFAALLIAFFVLVGEAVTRISGLGGSVATVAGVNPEAGESIFWGKGKCGTCHHIGGRGSAVRCPDLDGIGALAVERAAELTAGGSTMSPTDYLVQSIAEPSTYVVANYKDEMPKAYEPPIGLTAEEISATITYLQTLGGEADAAAITLPDAVRQAAAAASSGSWAPYIEGNATVGEYLFYDRQGVATCVLCHTSIDKDGVERGGDVGPVLSHVAGVRTPEFMLRSMLDPSAEIASGYEQTLIITTANQYEDGVKVREDEASITIKRMQANEVIEITVQKDEIRKISNQTLSAMPGNYTDLLTVQQLHDILAYLMTLG